jgi:hypothetical protein
VLVFAVLIFASLLQPHVLLAGAVSASASAGTSVRDVKIEVHGRAFENNGTSLKAQWLSSIDKLLDVLEPAPATLRMTYVAGTEGRAMSQERAARLRRMVEQRWESAARNYDLPIELLIVYRNE